MKWQNAKMTKLFRNSKNLSFTGFPPYGIRWVELSHMRILDPRALLYCTATRFEGSSDEIVATQSLCDVRTLTHHVSKIAPPWANHPQCKQRRRDG